MAKKETSSSDLNYERAFNELENIVESLEAEQKPLDEALKLFERGQELAQHCADLLDHAELRVKELNSVRNSIQQEE